MFPRTKALTEGAMLGGLVVLLTALPAYVPVPGLAMALILTRPLASAIAFVRHGWRTAALAAVVAGLTIAMLMGPGTGLSNLLFVGATGMAIGWSLWRRMSFAVSTAVTAVSVLALLIVHAAWILLLTGQNTATPLANSIDRAEKYLPEYARLLHIPASVLHVADWGLHLMHQLLPLMTAGLMLAMAIGTAAVMVGLARWTMRRLLLAGQARSQT